MASHLGLCLPDLLSAELHPGLCFRTPYCWLCSSSDCPDLGSPGGKSQLPPQPSPTPLSGHACGDTSWALALMTIRMELSALTCLEKQIHQVARAINKYDSFIFLPFFSGICHSFIRIGFHTLKLTYLNFTIQHLFFVCSFICFVLSISRKQCSHQHDLSLQSFYHPRKTLCTSWGALIIPPTPSSPSAPSNKSSTLCFYSCTSSAHFVKVDSYDT